MVNKKWKFILSHGCWWLRLESVDQIMEHASSSNHRYVEAWQELSTLYTKKDQETRSQFCHNGSMLAKSIDVLHRNSGNSLLVDISSLESQSLQAKLSAFLRSGFININEVGGWNYCDLEAEMVIEKTNLSWPEYTEKDIRVKTMANAERQYAGLVRDGYQYHWYAYVGSHQVIEGDQTKWNTREEAYQAAVRYLQEN